MVPLKTCWNEEDFIIPSPRLMVKKMTEFLPGLASLSMETGAVLAIAVLGNLWTPWIAYVCSTTSATPPLGTSTWLVTTR